MLNCAGLKIYKAANPMAARKTNKKIINRLPRSKFELCAGFGSMRETVVFMDAASLPFEFLSDVVPVECKPQNHNNCKQQNTEDA